MDRKAENLKAKKTLFKMRDFVQQVIDGKERYFVAEMMDRFTSLPARFQHAFIEHFCAEIPHEGWTRCLEDETLYATAIRSIAMYYTGMEKSSGAETTLEAFRQQIADFMKSDYYKRARAFGIKTKKSFTDSLATL